MNAAKLRSPEHEVPAIAAAIGEPARARILYCLMDGRVRTGTELAVVAGVTPSTASVHLARLVSAGLLTVLAQGKHRYYSLKGTDVGAALEALSVLAGSPPAAFVTRTPAPLRAARSCYDHLAGTLGVQLHDRLLSLQWLSAVGSSASGGYELSPAGDRGLAGLIRLDDTRARRRRFAFACLDWSERRPHLGGALAAALLAVMVERRWVVPELEGRVLSLTTAGVRALEKHFGLRVQLRPAQS
jgi:DNA-binding transcriptional ArsR family regulator